MTTKTIEANGNDVESAIRNGLAQLGVDRKDVTITVLDEGSKGILGIGRRDAQILLSAISKDSTSTQESKLIQEGLPVKLDETKVETLDNIPTPFDLVDKEFSIPTKIKQNGGQIEANTQLDSNENLAEETTIAEGVLIDLLQYLHIDAEIEASISDEDDQTKRRVPILNIEGEELNSLIGTRGETLKSLQFITRLMVSHRLKRRSDFVLDVSGYKERRRQALYRLAERMASKVEERGKSVTLEPMPSNERRLIHMALRENKNIFTQSVGEGQGRRVRIMLNKKR